jgi:hypothetical protein
MRLKTKWLSHDRIMSTVKEIEAAIGDLPRGEFFELITWIKGQFEDAWDRQMEDDVKSGKLDHLAREALAEYHAGQTRPFPPNEEPSDE